MTSRRALLFFIILIIAAALIALFLVLRRTEEEKTTNQLIQQNTMGNLRLTSTKFSANGRIPSDYTCQGRDVNPPLQISGVPAGTRSLALVMDDPDAPVGAWDHWIVWNIAPDMREIAENSIPAGAVQGKNSWGRSDWGGPCPPSGTHRYRFTIYVLSDVLSLAPGSDKGTLLSAIEGKILDSYTLIGLYSKT